MAARNPVTPPDCSLHIYRAKLQTRREFIVIVKSLSFPCTIDDSYLRGVGTT
jgi:hypothetical protein